MTAVCSAAALVRSADLRQTFYDAVRSHFFSSHFNISDIRRIVQPKSQDYITSHSLLLSYLRKVLQPAALLRAVNHIMAFPSPTTSTSLPTETFRACNCSQLDELRTAVTVLSVMLGMSIATAIAFIVYRSKRWKKKGAASRQGEVDELKGKAKQLEDKIESMYWHKFFNDPKTVPYRFNATDPNSRKQLGL